MASPTLLNAVERYLNNILLPLKRMTGPAHRGLFIDNNDGAFSAVHEPMVSEAFVVGTPAELATCLAGVPTHPTVTGEPYTPAKVYDSQTRTVHTHNGSSWDVTADFDDHLRPGRLYVNVITRKVFHVDLSGTVRQLKSGFIDNIDGDFHGEVPTGSLITGNALASLIGLSDGTAQHNTEPWLHFTHEGKTLYIAKKPYRHTISWAALDTANVVYGNRTITIQGKQYRIRLLKGASSDPLVGPQSGWDPVSTHGSEWNRLIYRIHGGQHTTPANTMVSEGFSVGPWAQYSDSDLSLDGEGVYGKYNWVQETIGGTTGRAMRGGQGVSNLAGTTIGNASSLFGWRPVLELVE